MSRDATTGALFQFFNNLRSNAAVKVKIKMVRIRPVSRHDNRPT
jgi:hypothetical protein